MHLCSEQNALSDASFRFGLDNVNIEANLLYMYLKWNDTIEKRRMSRMGGDQVCKRRRGGGDDLGLDATFS